MTLAIVPAVGLVVGAGCAAVEYTQTDLVALKRDDRTSLRGTGDVAVVHVPGAGAQVLWQVVCGLRGYPGDETVKLTDLLAAEARGEALLASPRDSDREEQDREGQQ
jgi:hypothetical protein